LIKYKNVQIEDGDILVHFKEMYEQMGDLISLQYGSSVAHKQNVNSDENGAAGRGRRFEFLTSLQRHFRNNFSDQQRQNQITLFLGNFNRTEEGPHFWERENIITH
jgi:hypothetical protein